MLVPSLDKRALAKFLFNVLGEDAEVQDLRPPYCLETHDILTLGCASQLCLST